MPIIRLLIVFLVYKSVLSSVNGNNSNSENDSKVLQMLIDCGGNVASLRNELQDMKDKLERLRTETATDTYIRWGRSSCPSGATNVYDGFAAGSYFGHSGAAANYICLSKKPKFNSHYSNPPYVNYIYGAEYQTFESIWDNLHNHDVPCAVCHIPRSSVIMVPGTDDCPENFRVEYRGYLMSGHHSHAAATEFVCVDGHPVTAPYSSKTDNNGKLFYFVRAICGSLKCLPYEEGKQITCAVCSYSP
ncbi:short-chain collagen C4-like [Mercenaria mercenaria]|uniref:short-chain collagen C4-like n=1 Tax=Mercenaria mercenaria TaxID=6596 RepID=UPI00234F8A45|nr:short-chain collagen C4-like [Mercenaria mercenaria]